MKRAIAAVLFVIIMLGLVVSHIIAATDSTSPAGQTARTEETVPPGYAVKLGDQTLFYYKDLKGWPADKRAKEVSGRLKRVAEDPNIPINIKISDYTRPLTLVSTDSLMLFVTIDEEARLEGISRHELAKERADIIRVGMERYRRDHARKQLILGVVYSLLATIVLFAVLYLVIRAYRALAGRVDVWTAEKLTKLHMRSLPFARTKRINAVITGSLKAARFIVLALVLYSYVHLLLGFFPWTRPLEEKLSGYVVTTLQVVGRAVWEQLPNVLVVGIIVFFTVVVLKLIRAVFNGFENGTMEIPGFYPEWAQPTYKICRILVVAFAAVVAFPYIPGSSSAAFKGVSIFLGVLFSLGSTSAVANILAGYSLSYRRVFKVGDRVKIGEFVGDVAEMRLQVVSLRTIKNEVVVVPSSTIVNTNVVNYSTMAKEKGLILHTKITIGYDAPWRQVEALLLMAAERTPGLLRERPPFVLQTSLDDFYVSYELNVYIDDTDRMAQTYAELHRNIQDAFNEYDVQIMSPSYRGDPAEPKVVPRERWYEAPARRPDDKETDANS